MSLHDEKLKYLEELAYQIREGIIETLLLAGSGHTAGPLGMAEIFTALYFHVLKHDPKKPDWPFRDRLILSNGHICPVQYVALAQAGYFSPDELKTLRKINSRLQGHPHRGSVPGVETTSGPLGSGLAQACGVALALRLDEKKSRVYCLTSDGEHQEGNHWEAVLFARKHRLSNLTVFVDRNNIQIDGNTEDVMPLDSLRAKYEAFNWNTLEIDGHNIREIVDATLEAEATWDRPTVIIAHTIPGKGVSFMEKDYTWHGRPPKDREEADRALREIRMFQRGVRLEHE
ncbi:transketolase [Candidatus Jorgensenbacteria bacterium RIFCSPLOWO2_01_FULL_45_25b]|uniref:Transketolase n=1 Tax=Candidatus Jorgensenbacteria bacterium RIFCSPLOWO2_01_FULL_45_25b TaxID=1798471 RepID=A0A1F6BZ10_9BACT|nr:MAG: transketolase [Candidatus Jorgensenbacteria bacterium RIFCSPLOWO2_01_FULL_45_25b]